MRARPEILPQTPGLLPFATPLSLSGDPLHIVKIVIGPIICSALLLLVAVGVFVMFKKR